MAEVRIGICNGICLTASDIGLPGNDVAYAHPTCPVHGGDPDHPFEHAETDGHGHQLCRCGAVKEAHREQAPCRHERISNGACFDCGVRRTPLENVVIGFKPEEE